MRLKLLLFLAVFWVAACSPVQGKSTEVSPDTVVTNPPQQNTPEQPVNNPYAPQPADSALTQGTVFIEEMGLLIRESYPPQISLTLSGNLPDPCHQLRMQVNEPDENNRIHVEAYSVADPDMVCIQVLEPFMANTDLGTYPSGHYSVWVNGELAGEFDS